jgi:LysR family transcriptional regulator, regulator for metE and metH
MEASLGTPVARVERICFIAAMRDAHSSLPAPRLCVADLRLVLALAAAGSTSGAQRQLHLTQSAVSRALLQLEARLECPLFERGARGLTPTLAGERLVRAAPQLLAALVALEAELRTPVVPARPLRLVCQCYTAYHWLPSALARLRSEGPELSLELAVEHTHDPVGALRKGHADVALLTTAEVDDPTLQQSALFSDEIVFVVARTHPLAARAALVPADLLAHTLITSSQAPKAESRWFIQRVFRGSVQARRARVERLPLTEAILDFTRAGLGVAVMSAWIAGPHLAGGELVARRLRRGPLMRPWRIAYRRELGPAVQRLTPILQAANPRPLLNPALVNRGGGARRARFNAGALD